MMPSRFDQTPHARNQQEHTNHTRNE
jgi:hypothetical protein